MRTIGLSPKVYIPGIGQIVLGIALLIAKLPVEGKSFIAAGFATFGIGYTAKPGVVQSKPAKR